MRGTPLTALQPQMADSPTSIAISDVPSNYQMLRRTFAGCDPCGRPHPTDIIKHHRSGRLQGAALVAVRR